MPTDDTTPTTDGLLQWMSGGNPPKPAPAAPPQKQPSTSGLLDWISGKPPKPSEGTDYLASVAKNNPGVHDILSEIQPSHNLTPRNPLVSLMQGTVKPAEIRGGYQGSSQAMADIGLVPESQSKEALGFAKQQAKTNLAADALMSGGAAPLEGMGALMKLSGLSPATAFATRAGVEAVDAATLHLPDILAPEVMGEVRKDISTGNPTADWLAQTGGGLVGDLATLSGAGKIVKAAAPLLEGTMAGSAATFGLHNLPGEVAKVATGEETPAQGIASEALSGLTGALFHGVNEAASETGESLGKGVGVMQAVEGNAAVGVGSTVAGSVISGKPITGADIAESAGMGAGFGLMGANGKEKSNYDTDLARVRESIVGQESGGNYEPKDNVTFDKKRGRDVHAVGKYQVMDYNIPDWTEQYLGKRMTPEEFKSDHGAQDAVSHARIKEYYDANLEKTGDPRRAAYLTALDWYGRGKPASGPPPSSYARQVVKRFDNATGTGYAHEDVQYEALKPPDTQTQTSSAPQAEAATVESDTTKDVGTEYDQKVDSIINERTPQGDTQQIVDPDGQTVTIPTQTQDATEPQKIEPQQYIPDPLLDPSTRDNSKLAASVEPQTPDQAVLAYMTRPTGEKRFTGAGAKTVYPGVTPESFYKELYPKNSGEAASARRLGIILSEEKGGKSIDALAQDIQETHGREHDPDSNYDTSDPNTYRNALIEGIQTHLSDRSMRHSMETELADYHPDVIEARHNEETQRQGTEAMIERAHFGDEPNFTPEEQHQANDLPLIDRPDAIPDHIASILENYTNDQTGQIDHERLKNDLGLADENSTGKLQELYAGKEEIQRLATTTADSSLPAVSQTRPDESDQRTTSGQSQSEPASEVTPSWGDERIASAKAKWDALNKEQSGTLGVSIFADPRRIAAAAEFMAGHVANGIHAVGDFAKKALEEFGEAVLPHISELYARTKEHLTSEGRGDLADLMSASKPPPVTPEGQLFEANEPADSFGIRHQDINARRAESGQPIFEKAELTQDEQAHHEAIQELHDNKNAGRELVDRLEKSVGKKNESAVVGMEKKLLGLETQDRWERRNAALDKLNNAKPEDLEKAQAAFNLASKEYMSAEDILSRAGSLAGKALQEQKVRNSDDFSVEHLTKLKTEAINEGVKFSERVPLNAEQANEIKDFVEKDVAASKAVEEHQNKVHDAQGLEYFNKLFKDFVSDAREAKQAKKKYVDFATEQADKARARMKARQATLHAELLPVADIADLAIIGGEYIAKGVSAIADWSRAMVTEFGEKIRPHLEQIFDASKTRDEANQVATGGRIKAEKNSSDVLGKINPANISGTDIFNLARALKKENGIGGGLEGFNQLMKVTHESLARVMSPDFTERNVRELFTHYGDVTVPSQEQDLKDLREGRQLGLLILKTEDINDGLSAKRTGNKRDAPTPDVRDAMKELQKAMRAHPELKVTDPERQTKTSLDSAKTRVTNQIEDLDRQIKSGDRNAARQPLKYDQEMKDLVATRNAKQKQLNELDGKLEARTNAQKLATYKKVVAANNARLEAKIAAGDYSKPAKNVTVMDAEALHLQAIQQRNRQNFMAGVEKDRLANRTALEKVVDGAMKARVLSAISSPLIGAKLVSAVAIKTVTEPMKEIFGGVISKMIPELANRAPIEGGFSLASEKAALHAEFTVGITAAWNKAIHMKDSDINILYGKSKDKYGTPTQLDRVFYTHDALKEPLVQAVFARGWTKQMLKFQEKFGRQPSESEKTEIGKSSMANALRAKFQQDNFISRAHANILHILMRDKTNPIAGKVLNLVDKALLPVVKTPTNIFGEVNEHLTGLISGSIRAVAAYRAGIENITPQNADLIMRKLKNGTLGAVILAAGYSQRNKDELPSLLGHAPAAALYDLGADIGKRLDGIDRNEEGLGSATLQEMMTLTQTLPYADMITRIAPALRPGKGLVEAFSNYTGEMAKSILVPGVVQDAARMSDQKDGTGALGTILKNNTQQRTPEDWLDHLKTGIPGLREQVPEKEEKKPGTRRHRR